MQKFTFLSCLTDAGANIRGSSNGPIEIKAKLFGKEMNAQFYDFSSKEKNPANNIKEIVANASQEHLKSLSNESFPVLLGGDHSCAMASISSSSQFCEKTNIPFYVFWFDAHSDIHTTDTSETGNIHGMPVAMLTNLDKSGLVLHPKEYLKSSNFFLFGARSIDDAEQKILKDNGILFCKDDFSQCRGTIEKLLKDCPQNSFIHVSFDVDCLCPEDAPGVSTPEHGGFKINEALDLLAPLFADHRFKALDVVEYNPTYDSKNQQTLNHIDKIFDLLLKNRS